MGTGIEINVDGGKLKGKKKHRIRERTKQESEPNLDLTEILELPDRHFTFTTIHMLRRNRKSKQHLRADG